MSASQIFKKTLPFAWAKLFLALITVAFAGILFATFMGLGWLFNSNGVTGILLLIWISCVGIIRFVVMHYLGYLIKAGHVAVITEAFITGNVPDNQVVYGKQMVAQRFATSNVYFAIDKLVSGAVKQLQRGIEKVESTLDFIPGMETIASIAKFFVDISLGYIDECCLGYTFYKKEQNAFKSAADGVVIYAQNWKKLLKDAAKTMALVITVLVTVTLICFLVLGILFRLLDWSGTAAFILSLLIAMAIKFAFVDSYILVKMMSSYMEDAPSTPLTFDLYQRLSGLSPKFKELFQKGQQATPNYAGIGTVHFTGKAQPTSSSINCNEPQSASIICNACGASNGADVKFCLSCGTKLR
ncbi:MAG: hypothetical protein VB035_14465 [Candidatus Fimivivens sp.]|nr:hypothetical protein [Candidatus Fimivivens sp.]